MYDSEIILTVQSWSNGKLGASGIIFHNLNFFKHAHNTDLDPADIMLTSV